MNPQITVIREVGPFLELEKEWDRMVADRFDGHPLFCHFWFANYRQAYFPKAPLYVLTAHRQGELVGAMPMILGRRRMGGIPLKEARLTAGDHSPLNRILVATGDDAIMTGFLETLLKEGVDLIYIEDVPDLYPKRRWMEEFCRDHRLGLECRSVRQSPFIPTVGSFDEYRKRLSKKFREILNNRLNKINRAGGFEIRMFNRTGDVEAAVEQMEIISRGSWQGQNGTGLFSGEKNRLFYTGLITHALTHGYGRVAILLFDQQPAAFEFHVFHGRTEYCLKGEYAQAYNAVAPGAVLDLELVKQAFASEVEVYDLMGYTDSYKLRWTEQTTPYFRYFIFNRSAAGRTAHAVYFKFGDRIRRLKRAAKDIFGPTK